MLHRRPLALHSPGPASCSRSQSHTVRPCYRAKRAWRPCASTESAEAEHGSAVAADAKEASHAQDAAAEPRIKRTVASLNMLLGVEDDPVEGAEEESKPDAVSFCSLK